MSDFLRHHGLQPTRLLCPWDCPGKNTGVGSHSLLQGIFPTQGSNPNLLHCRQIIYCLSHQGNPLSWHKVAQSCPTLWTPWTYTVNGILQARILEWVAIPFSRGSSQPRDWTQVSHIAGRFFTSWATRETHATQCGQKNKSNIHK